MSSDVAVRIEGLSKAYKIRHDEQHSTLVEQVLHRVTRPRQRSRVETLWALRDINLEITRGEVVGLIGRNGAGKSTLLKVLSRITPPTEGRVDLQGHVGSLLEVGTGFHPELTGRENIYLNGSILGMKKRDIDRQFVPIVEFAGTERFLDTPVKRYSSGMYVRLAFAVAAHLEPEILIVDEVLAVGDVEFQKKCLGKMGEVAGEGRTVLFVSHNAAALQHLTERSLLIENGQLILDDTTSAVLSRYLASNDGTADGVTAQGEVVDLRDHPNRLPGMNAALTRMWMTVDSDSRVRSVPMGAEVSVHVEFELDHTPPQPLVGLVFETLMGERVFYIDNKIAPGAAITTGRRSGVFSCRISRLPLVAGEYKITVAFAESIHATYDKIERAFSLSVTAADVYGTGHSLTRDHGHIFVDARWSFSPQSYVKPNGQAQTEAECDDNVNESLEKDAEASAFGMAPHSKRDSVS